MYRVDGTASFDTALGYVGPNIAIYVAVSAGDDGNGCDHFAWDFTIWRFASGSPLSFAFSNPLSLARLWSSIPATYAGYRRMFRSVTNIKEGWQYMWNGRGAIGNNANYVVRMIYRRSFQFIARI